VAVFAYEPMTKFNELFSLLPTRVMFALFEPELAAIAAWPEVV